MILPCISIHNPWAWLIVEGLKDVENRIWNSRYRGPILIHASKAFTSAYYDNAVQWVDDYVDTAIAELIPSPSELKFGGIVGAAMMTGVVQPGTRGSAWHNQGDFGFKLEKATALPLRPYRGLQRFFRVETTVEEDMALLKAGLIT